MTTREEYERNVGRDVLDMNAVLSIVKTMFPEAFWFERPDGDMCINTSAARIYGTDYVYTP